MSATHFINLPTFHRKRVFQNEQYGELLTETLFRVRQENGFLLHDYVVMPDHVHLLLTIYGTTPVGEVMQAVREAFTAKVREEFGYSGEIWGAAYRAGEVRSAAECAECIKHIHSNPVRVGFCEKDMEYRMSSKASRWVLDPLPVGLRAAALEHA